MKKIFTLLCAVALFGASLQAQDHSVAMQWNETQLNCIRNYSPKPTVHARNLFHASVVMYDMWAVYDDAASTFFLGKTFGGYTCPFNGVPPQADVEAAREKAISYAMYRYLWNRYTIFTISPAKLAIIQGLINAQMTELGYDPTITSTTYGDGDPAKLGNYIAAKMEEMALGDGSNQQNNYANVYYTPVNGDIWANLPGAGDIVDPNRWQELALDYQADQAGNPIQTAPPALSHEWGNVIPFALTDDQKTTFERDGHDWQVYLHQGPPPFLDPETQTGVDDFFKWGFLSVAKWHGFHNENNDVMIDLSPASTGGLGISDASQLPTTFEEFQDFYDFDNGGDPGSGYALNPVTGLPYEPQIVPRGDYCRVLSQFWADGPSSETPPGHWFTLINYVANHDLFEKRWEGVGPILPDLEWDVKAYFALGGAIHDAAVTCWGHKGYYDYIRPISAIRWMCEQGQSTDPDLPHYSPAGVPLIPGFTELVLAGDPLMGFSNEHLNKIKIWSWRGPYGTVAQGTQMDGPGWLLGEDWWTYQVATFVTPPFSGYFSGHSTFSRSGAEAVTLITGSEYFPGGLGEFIAPADTYLVADQFGGPSVEIKLQWASYRDASDQCSLSRIYGGLHPPQDDIPGRKAGLIIGPQAFAHAEEFFDADQPHATITTSLSTITDANTPAYIIVTVEFSEPMDESVAPFIQILNATFPALESTFSIFAEQWEDGHYEFHYTAGDANTQYSNVQVKVTNARDLDNKMMVPALSSYLNFDTKNPTVTATVVSTVLVNDSTAANGTFSVNIDFSENMLTSVMPEIAFTADDPFATLTYNTGSWVDANTFMASFIVTDANVEQLDIDIQVTAAKDALGNTQVISSAANIITIDTRNPVEASATVSNDNFADGDVGTDVLTITVVFDEAMNTSSTPTVSYPVEDGAAAGLTISSAMWLDNMTYEVMFDLSDANADVADIDVQLAGATDIAGNAQVVSLWEDALDIDTQNPMVTATTSGTDVVADADAATGSFTITLTFNEDMDTGTNPVVSFPNEDPLTNGLTYYGTESGWIDENTFEASYNVSDEGVELWNIDVEVNNAVDQMGNNQVASSSADEFSIDTRNPEVVSLLANTYALDDSNIGTNGFSIIALFDEAMDENSSAVITFPGNDVSGSLTWNSDEWINATNYEALYTVSNVDEWIADIDVNIAGLQDLAGNPQEAMLYEGFFSIELGVGITENEIFSDVNVYPNPVTSGTAINVYIRNATSDLVVQLFDMSGQLITQVVNADNKRFIQLDTNNLAAGMYFVNLIGSEGQAAFNVAVVK
ncbi:MAG: T9SS type A sorting domain-containing protein [Flavobacteriales bacterium]|nr:T9SS type A sorting domain-containing protein [Flavobacteriales bacterium]